MAPPKLYTMDLSPPCRAVLLTAKVIKLNLDLHEVNLLQREHLDAEFVKKNPQHTIPTLDDNGFILWDSHAIIRYLVGKYAKDDQLYPKDLQKRALIDQRLHFEGEIIFARLRAAVKPMFFGGKKTFDEDAVALLKDSLEMLNKFLEGKKWLVDGNTYTLADISCVCSVSCMPAFFPLDKYPNVARWLKACESEIPGYDEANMVGVKKFFEAVKNASQK
ncbi:glutathione S-transferase 1-like [Chelonus insularis]|uniref:glutathione S-transferase 1-like n=1 Tax=Chelonus insularis TaxID=460826 RepID=UPI00158A6C64|nr:glutathione S-transferase 1-like [Chelonus insularis]